MEFSDALRASELEEQDRRYRAKQSQADSFTRFSSRLDELDPAFSELAREAWGAAVQLGLKPMSHSLSFQVPELIEKKSLFGRRTMEEGVVDKNHTVDFFRVSVSGKSTSGPTLCITSDGHITAHWPQGISKRILPDEVLLYLSSRNENVVTDARACINASKFPTGGLTLFTPRINQLLLISGEIPDVVTGGPEVIVRTSVNRDMNRDPSIKSEYTLTEYIATAIARAR